MSSSYPAAQFYQGQREQADLPYQQSSNGTNVASAAYPTPTSHQPMQSQSYPQSQAAAGGPQSQTYPQHAPLGQPPEGYVLAYVPASHLQNHSQMPPPQASAQAPAQAPVYSPYAQQNSPAAGVDRYSMPPPSQLQAPMQPSQSSHQMPYSQLPPSNGHSNPQALQHQFAQMNLQPQQGPAAALSPPAYSDRRSSQGSLNSNGYPDEKAYAKKSQQYAAPNYPPSGSSHSPSGSFARNASPRPSSSVGPSYPPPATSSSASPVPGHNRDEVSPDMDTSEMSLKDKVRFGLKNHFRNPLDPPPEAFSREPTPGLPYHPFAPFTIVAKNEHIDGGFPPVYMGSELGPHDCTEADWTRFREDVAIMGRLTGKQQIVSGVAPITMHIGATGFLVTKLIQKGMKKTRLPPVLELIELWNSAFFERRRLRVTMVTADMVKEARENSGEDRHGSHSSHDSPSYKADFKSRKDEIKAAYIAEHGSDKGWKKYKEKMEKQMEKDDKRYKKEHKKEREAEKDQQKKVKDEYKKPRLYIEAI